MSYALMSSGGKDSVLALDRARRQMLNVRYMVNVYEGSSERVRFHGVRRELIERQADSLDLELILGRTGPQDFDAAFGDTLEELRIRGVTGVVFGNIHLSDIREWYEQRVRAFGMEHIEPLWGDPPIELVWETVERGYQAIVTSVDLSKRAAGFLGRELDADLVTDIGVTDELDPCGEAGEYHTFVYDGPEFGHAVKFDVGPELEFHGHRFVDLVPASAQKKATT